jgi:hypothetical protein
MPFATADELIAFARKFVGDRITSLRGDVAFCLDRPPYAPFPALLYCFATVDLLGALAAGEAARTVPSARQPGKRRRVDTTANAREYMVRFMGYERKRAAILQTLFRHKMVHLAQPGPIVQDDRGRRISWIYEHRREVPPLGFGVPRTPNHLRLVPITAGDMRVADGWTIPGPDHLFWLDVTDFLQDVVRSVEGNDGYLASLSRDARLRSDFASAVEQIHEATPVR